MTLSWRLRREQQPHALVGHFVRPAVGQVGDDDATFGAGIDIDVVEADLGDDDDLALLKLLDDAARGRERIDGWMMTSASRPAARMSSAVLQATSRSSAPTFANSALSCLMSGSIPRDCPPVRRTT